MTKPTMADYEALWAKYQPLVIAEINSALNRYGHDYHLEYEDLEAVAMETLWRCIERFDPSRLKRKPKSDHALFAGFFKAALFGNLSRHARKVIPHYYTGDSSKARWHHVKTTSWDALPEHLQDKRPLPEV